MIFVIISYIYILQSNDISENARAPWTVDLEHPVGVMERVRENKKENDRLVYIR